SGEPTTPPKNCAAPVSAEAAPDAVTTVCPQLCAPVNTNAVAAANTVDIAHSDHGAAPETASTNSSPPARALATSPIPIADEGCRVRIIRRNTRFAATIARALVPNTSANTTG